MPNLTWITKKYFPQLPPRLINSGNCYNWAYIAYMNYNSSSLFTVEDYGGHAFVKIGECYFDAQNARGVWHWSQLDLLQEMYRNNLHKVLPWKQSLNVFLQYWRENGKHPIINAGNDVHNWHNRKYR